jgi:hypothetical protein
MSSSTSVRVISTGPADRREWEEACAASPCSTFYHTPWFADIFIRAGRGHAAAAVKVEFSDGVSAIVPLVRKTNLGGLLRIHFSMPAFCYGGWVSRQDLSEAHAQSLAAWLRRFPDLVWRENPFDPLLAGIDLGQADDDFTQVVDLAGGFAAAGARFDHAHRKAVKKARAAGVTVAEASSSGQWENYFSLYQRSRDRWKGRGLLRSRGYDAALIDAVRECPPEYRKLWIAEVKGRPAAAIICFYWKRHAAAWLGAGAAEFFDCRPNNLLYEEAIRHAAEAQFSWFDCNPSAGLAGVAEFKAHLGAKKLRARIVNKRSTLRRFAERLRSISP